MILLFLQELYKENLQNEIFSLKSRHGLNKNMARIKKYAKIHGWLLLDKPVGISSTQALNAVQHIFGVQKIGHGGTLDPFASGLLPIAMGEATKCVDYSLQGDKTYEFTLKFGASTDSMDSTGDIIAQNNFIPTQAEILAILPQFIGEISQIPPNFSAIHVAGKRAYDLARQGVDFKLEARKVKIYDCQLLHYNDDSAILRAKVSKGTYIRVLAQDIATRLGALGHCSELRRIRVANFILKNAFSLDYLKNLSIENKLDETLLGLGAGLDGISALALSQLEASLLRMGKVLNLIRKTDFERLKNLDDNKIMLAYIAPHKLHNQPEFVGFVKKNHTQIIADRLFVY